MSAPADGGALAVTGANSSVGRALLQRIARSGTVRAVALVRREAALGDLPDSPRITPRVAGYDQPERLAAALAGARSAVHLAGILFESRTTNYRTGNVESTRALVRAAQAARVRHLVFISSLGANPHASNGYFRSKGEAERIVADAGMDAAIIRTPLLLGPDTAGGRALLRAASGTSARVLGGGAHRLRPLDVDDLCLAILACCRQAAGGRTCELVGPTALTQRALIERTARLLGHDIAVRSSPVWLARLGAAIAGRFRTGGMTPDVIDVITSEETVRRNADADLGITLTPLSDTLAGLCEARTP